MKDFENRIRDKKNKKYDDYLNKKPLNKKINKYCYITIIIKPFKINHYLFHLF